ncbi:MAG TPA: hypothetical protein VJ046_01110 [Candidatus Paceibacterota bacterium]|nr:hypothetical protein [Candidatus Paceibacterota bacterium]
MFISNLFFSLMIGALLVLIFGLIKPPNKIGRGKFGIIFGALVFLFLILGSSIKPPQQEPQKTPSIVRTSPPETSAYLDSEGTTALFTYGIDPQEFDKQTTEAVLSGDADRLVALMEKYVLETPKDTKVLLLGEEFSYPPEPLLGRNQTVVNVKIKILDGVHTGKVGWANKEQIKLTK